MKNSMTWLVLSNSKDAPSFDELKAMYLKLGGKKDTSKLSKCQLAHLVDYLIIIKNNRADFLKLANDVLEDKVERTYSEDWLHCEYKVWNFKASITVDWCQYNDIVYQCDWELTRYLFEDVCDSFDSTLQWLKEMKDQLEEEIEWTQIDQTINHWDDWEEVIDQREWKYKWYTFKLWIRTYNEDATEDEPAYSEGEDECWCVETDEVIWKDEWHYDDHIKDYVNNLK